SPRPGSRPSPGRPSGWSSRSPNSAADGGLAPRLTSPFPSEAATEVTEKPYPDVAPNADHPAIERGVLERWAEDRTFQRSIEQRPADDEYVFYDGPPFANGLPHYGHFLT